MKERYSVAFKWAQEFTQHWEEALQSKEDDTLPCKDVSDAYLGLAYDWLRKIAAEDCLKQDINEAEIMEIMHTEYWKPLACERLPLPLAVFLYDSSVHIGVSASMQILQECCNVVGEAHLDEFKALTVNGVNGKDTIKLAKALKESNLDFYTARMCVRQRLQYYVQYIKKLPEIEGVKDASEHLAMWKNRCQALLEHLAMLERGM